MASDHEMHADNSQTAQRLARAERLKRRLDFSNFDPQFFPLDISMDPCTLHLARRPPPRHDWLCIFTPDIVDKRNSADVEYISLIPTDKPENFADETKHKIYPDTNSPQRFVYISAMNFDYANHTFSKVRINKLFAGVYIYKNYASAVADSCVICGDGEYKTRWEFTYDADMGYASTDGTYEHLLVTADDLYLAGAYNGYNHVFTYITPNVIEVEEKDKIKYSTDGKTETLYYSYFIHGIWFNIWRDANGISVQLESSCRGARGKIRRRYNAPAPPTAEEIALYQHLKMPESEWFNREMLEKYMQRQLGTVQTYKKMLKEAAFGSSKREEAPA